MPRRCLARLYRDEFTGYSPAKSQQHLLAGLTVAAAGLATAIVEAEKRGCPFCQLLTLNE